MMLLQPLWSFLRGHAPLLHSPVFPVLFSVSTYLSCCAPFLLLDLLAPRCALVHRYKLQPQSSASLASVRSCLAQTLYNHVVFIFPLTLTHWYLRPAHLPQEAPPLPRLLAQVLVCLLLFDFQSFTWHLLHHRVPWLYRTFHKLHHSSSAPSALTTEHSGSMETLSLGFFAAANPVLLGLHPLSELVFFLLNIWLSVEDHCGYDLPWAPHRLVPLGLYGGARHHDLHHLKSNCNYAPYFTHWDRLAGTLCTLQDD
ncbi:cholesterol 25-hydroxylase-like protein [Cyclopterus lumpus]|uniref:Cholesterol 25-hydroxylase n=1 Tax=Cyclopterus lumpus TaxID=8103 RepID=A0A8C2WIT7_CYCLU|nr:cholesterol 25-hydroxylase-like protein [Cyclopterus lumpus]XP_034413964.1 cholesterol 25-hydroxylase-like protein [Cyclopterus lumpus]